MQVIAFMLMMLNHSSMKANMVITVPDSVDALITSGEIGEGAEATANIGAGGTNSQILILQMQVQDIVDS